MRTSKAWPELGIYKTTIGTWDPKHFLKLSCTLERLTTFGGEL